MLYKFSNWKFELAVKVFRKTKMCSSVLKMLVFHLEWAGTDFGLFFRSLCFIAFVANLGLIKATPFHYKYTFGNCPNFNQGLVNQTFFDMNTVWDLTAQHASLVSSYRTCVTARFQQNKYRSTVELQFKYKQGLSADYTTDNETVKFVGSPGGMFLYRPTDSTNIFLESDYFSYVVLYACRQVLLGYECKSS